MDVERLSWHAVRLGVRRSVAQGLLLAHDPLALDLGSLNSELRCTPMPVCWHGWQRRRFVAATRPHRHDTIAGVLILPSQALLRPGLRYPFAELALKFANPRDCD
jgi:hypothetical protein